MKQLYFLLATLFFSAQIQAQNAPFVTIWQVNSTGLNITIPTSGTGYNYTIDFGDGTLQNNVTGDISHTYSATGAYTVSITGDFPRIRFGNSTNPDPMVLKIKSVEQWGDIQWQSMESAFRGCSSLIINAADAPDLSLVADMSHMFYGAQALNQSINHWDVSNVTHMPHMFDGASAFNQPLNNWDVSNVMDMSYMFNKSQFNQAIGNWDVSNVMDMSYMFNNSQFNQAIGNWDVSNVMDMSYMFSNSQFNQAIGNWDVSNVINMTAMFKLAISFNQSLSNWDVSNVTNMIGMFYDATSFNQPIDNWNVSNVTNMGFMFRKAQSFNQPLNNWNISNVTDMEGMFDDAQTFNQDLSNWQFTTRKLNSFLNLSGLDVVNYNNFLTHLASLGISNGILGAYNLEHCNQAAKDYLYYNSGWTIWGDKLSNECNKIIGDILFDDNNNGCDPNDNGVHGFMINANDGFFDFTTFSNNGTYHLDITGSSFTVSIPNAPSYFTVSPASANVTFSGSNTEVLDFCVTANQSINDLNITLLPPSEARPGFEADYRLVVRNVGTQAITNVDATLQFDDLMQQFVNSIPAPGNTMTNTLTFPIGTLQPFQKFEAEITMQTFQPPTVNGGDILNFTANVTPAANDFTPNDNTFNLAQVVVNSYDPNDKQVLQGEELHIDKTDEYLDYLIRFQNTGTASAINVRILDTLHPKLDWNTLVPISASHDYYVKIKDGNHVEFRFDDIHLPDSISNEPASHGFVAYKIKPKSDVQVGDVISGDAAIYFDFNAPIITNMVSTTVIESLGISDVSGPLNQIVLYPNPTDKTLHIHLTEGLELLEVLIYDLQGREVQKIGGKETTLDVESLSPGLYFLYITTDRGVVNHKMVKK